MTVVVPSECLTCDGPNGRHASWCGGSIAELAGIDVSVCEFCEEPLDESEPWTRGMDGCGAHLSCLELYL